MNLTKIIGGRRYRINCTVYSRQNAERVKAAITRRGKLVYKEPVRRLGRVVKYNLWESEKIPGRRA